MPQLDPALTFELAIGGTGSVGMDAKASGKIARAGQPLPRCELVAKDSQDHLCDELLSQGNIAGSVQPEAHAFFFQLASCSARNGSEVKAGLGRRYTTSSQPRINSTTGRI